ncbi:MAG: hypothetical protein R2941_03845 [Desulfobacterales bacterium]
MGIRLRAKQFVKNHMGLRLTKEAVNMNIGAGGLEQALNIEDRNQTLLSIGQYVKKI